MNWHPCGVPVNAKPGLLEMVQLKSPHVKTRSQELFRVSHMGTESQGFGVSSTAFPGHKQGAGWDAGLLGLEPVPIWDPGACKARTLATGPPSLTQEIVLKKWFFSVRPAQWHSTLIFRLCCGVRSGSSQPQSLGHLGSEPADGNSFCLFFSL